MEEGKTNIAYLLGLLGARARDVVTELGADKSLVSRWIGGKQKIMTGHGWDEKLADFLFARDERLRHPVIPDLLRAYYPGSNPATAAQERELLIRWLCAYGHREAEYQRDRGGFQGLVMGKIKSLAAAQPEREPEVEHPAGNAVVYGVEGVRGAALQCIDLLLGVSEPQEILYVCPEGLDMYTRDKKFSTKLMDELMKLFAAGHTMSVVLRTDYKMTDVSEFSGRWLVAHLLGYVKSYYYDEFHKTYEDKMLAAARGQMCMRVREQKSGGTGKIYTAVNFDPETVESTWNECEQYRNGSRQRFHYQYFKQPDGFMQDVSLLPDRAHYQFARLPHFCVADAETFQRDFGLSDAEMETIRLDYSPILTGMGYFEADTTVRHIFCETDIENALLKFRHVSQELSEILGRRVVFTTQALADRLTLLQELLKRHKNYEVCFLPDRVFQKLTMQIACWGDRAAIGWIPGGKSTACRDYMNVNALTGFCAAIWDMVPGPLKLRRVALSKIGVWLKKAQKYGYKVE